MGMTKLFMSGVLLLGLLGVLWSGGFAVSPSVAVEPSDGDANTAAAAPAPAAPPAAMAEQPVLKRASNVLHARIKSPEGKSLGKVHDLVLTSDLNGISYVAVSSGGFLGIGETLHAVPWRALSASVNNTYVIPVSEQQFKQSRGFKASSWPSTAETGWITAGEEPVYRGRAAVTENVQDRRFTRIRGSEVRGRDGGNAGDVRDLVIVMDTGQIAYTVLSYGGLFGIGARYAAVPQSAITLEPARHMARLDATPAAVHANSFTPNRWPDLASPMIARQLDRAFGVPPTGPALAFVPPGPVAAAPSRTPPRPSARTTTPPPSGAAVGAEPAPAELTGTFNPSAITSIDGTVLNEGKFRITSTGPEMLWLRVRTTDNRTVLVNLGPRSYIAAQNFYVVPGDRIHLTGSEVATTRGRQVFLPTEATYENQTLRLRSTTGTPLWEGPGATATTPPGQPPGATTNPSSQAPPSSQPGAPPLGYVPGQEPGTPGQAGTGGQTMTQFTPSGIVTVDAFDLSHPQTIEGTVTEVGKSQPPSGGPEVIWLRVRTTTGQPINVQVGPRDYVSQQGFFVVNGDQVRMNGWNARIPSAPGATPVFVVASISQDGHTLQLRSRNGEPLWTTAGAPGSPAGATSQTPGAQTPAQTPTPGTAGSTPRSTSRSTAEPNEPNKP